MSNYWEQIESAIQPKHPKISKKLPAGATPESLDLLDKQLGVVLPESFRSFYSIHNGQGRFTQGLVFGLELLSLRRIKQEWSAWKSIGLEINEELAYAMSSEPPGYIKPLYVNLKWIPFIADGTGSYIGLDFDPDKKGIEGQVIVYGRNDNKKKLIAASFEEYLDMFVQQLNALDWEVDSEEWDITTPKYSRAHYFDWKSR